MYWNRGLRAYIDFRQPAVHITRKHATLDIHYHQLRHDFKTRTSPQKVITVQVFDNYEDDLFSFAR